MDAHGSRRTVVHTHDQRSMLVDIGGCPRSWTRTKKNSASKITSKCFKRSRVCSQLFGCVKKNMEKSFTLLEMAVPRIRPSLQKFCPSLPFGHESGISLHVCTDLRHWEAILGWQNIQIEAFSLGRPSCSWMLLHII